MRERAIDFSPIADDAREKMHEHLIAQGWTPPALDPEGNGKPHALEDLAARLYPNPAKTAAGTLAIILDGIDRLDDEKLARTLAMVGARQAGLDAGPLSDEAWAAGDIQQKLKLFQAVQGLKQALREMAK